MSLNTPFLRKAFFFPFLLLVWKACLGRSQTENRLYIPISNETCFLCCDQSESHSHSLHKCAFNQMVPQNILETFRRTEQIYQFSHLKISVTSSKQRTVRQILSLTMAVNPVITCILWMERNHTLLRNEAWLIQSTTGSCIYIVECRSHFCSRKCKKEELGMLFLNLGT